MTLLTPVDLAVAPTRSELHLPEYNWKKQTRVDTIIAGTTMNTKQTFDHKGMPKDNTSDQD